MSRKRARENRRIKAWETRQGIREEMIGSRNRYGIKDPTPYEAVRTIVREQDLLQAF